MWHTEYAWTKLFYRYFIRPYVYVRFFFSNTKIFYFHTFIYTYIMQTCICMWITWCEYPFHRIHAVGCEENESRQRLNTLGFEYSKLPLQRLSDKFCPRIESTKCSLVHLIWSPCTFRTFHCLPICLFEVQLPYEPSCPSVGWLVGRSVCWLSVIIFVIRREVYFQSNC